MDTSWMENAAYDSDVDGVGADAIVDTDSDNEKIADDISDIDKSRIQLYDGIIKMVEENVEEIRRSRTERKKKRKRNIKIGAPFFNEEDAKAYSRCSVPYLSKVIASIICSEHRISLVRQMGFEETLHIDECYIPRLFAQWIGDNTVPDEEAIKFENKYIPCNPQGFQDVLGIPAGHLRVETDEELGKAAFLSFFGLSEVPTIKFLGDKIINNKDLGDDEFCICYGSVVLGAFICPNSCPRPSTKYMGALVDVPNIKNRNWCKFAHEWLMWYTKKYLKERAKNTKLTITLGGCIYQQAVRYLDFIDLGPIKLPPTLPRIRVWKGDLIKHFSVMDKGKDGNYGLHTIKDISETCYGRSTIAPRDQDCMNHSFRNELDTVAGEFLSNKVKVDLVNAFQRHMIDVDDETNVRTQAIVIDFLKIIASEVMNAAPPRTSVITSQQGGEQVVAGDHKQKKPRRDFECSKDFLIGSKAELDNNKADSCLRQQFNTAKNLCKEGDKMYETSLTCLRSFSLNHTCSEEDSASSKHKLSGTNQMGLNNDRKDELEGQVKAVEADFSQKRSISLNHSPSIDDHVSSSSCNNSKAKPCNLEREVLKIRVEEEKSKAHFVGNMQCIAQEYVESDPRPEQYNSREEFLIDARKKYFFNDASYPNMRLFEYEDDNGKYIDEPELWRPLPGDYSQDNNTNTRKEPQHIQSNSLIEKPKCNNNLVDGFKGNNSFAYSPPKETSPAFRSNADSEFEFSSIQCAQRQPSYCPVTVPQDGRSREIIQIDSQPSQPSPTTPSAKGYFNSEIRGRRLFHDVSMDAAEEDKEQKLNQQMSPEVEYLGERSFNIVCNNMAATSDDLYNAGLTLGSAGLANGKENVPPKRVINRSTWLRSPYEQNQRPVIEPKHVKLHEIITTLCDDEEYKYKYVINIDNCRVYLKQLGTSMKMDGWVEAWVVNAYCRKLFKDNHPRKSQKHWFFHTSSEYFLEKWPTEFMKNKWRESTIKGFHGADSARKLHLSHRLHFPSLYEGHWFVFVVDLVARKFLFLDSYYCEDSSYHKNIDTMLIENFKDIWNSCNLKDMGFNNFETFFPNVPKQKTPNDCGIFTMKFMEFYCPRNPTACSFSATDIPAFRVQIAVDSMYNQYNTEIDNMNFISSFDLKAYQSRIL